MKTQNALKNQKNFFYINLIGARTHKITQIIETSN